MGRLDRHVEEVMVDQEQQADVSKEFDGASHFSWGRWISYNNPGSVGNNTSSYFFRHRDILHRVTWRTKDTDRYISPTYGKPFHLVVQASREALQDKTGAWRRTEVGSNAPWILRLSSWALKEVLDRQKGTITGGEIAMVGLKVLAVVPCQLFLLLYPIGGNASWSSYYYKSVPLRSWEYPLYARNELDARPSVANAIGNFDQQLAAGKEYERQMRPRQLVVWGEEGWRIESNTADIPYLFISYTRRHWDPDYPEAVAPLQKLARHLTRNAGLRAYWLDHQCIQQGADMTQDIHQICDVVRGAEQVVVAVPNLDLDCIAVWGSRMWTLPEVLICQNNVIKFCDPDRNEMERSRVALAQGIWANDQACRLLAEHFSGTMTLSRLELIQVGLKALSARETKALYSNGDLAYALMGLLNRRPKANFQDNQFQALARLSLANDSDRIVERMMCMLPPALQTAQTPYGMPIPKDQPEANGKFVLEDQLNANLWDIEPMAQVAGVCQGSGLLLDGCRGASIRWKDIPAVAYVNKSSWRRSMTAMALRSGPIWFIVGCSLVNFVVGLGAIFLIIGLALIISSPWTVIMLYGGKVWGAAPWLIGIEGTMPIDKIEKFTFGNAIGRLRWAPSSSLLAYKNRDERLGAEPNWISGTAPRPQLPLGHRLFTLIDTGTMTVHVFTAERPPTAAIVAGREGGMLRVILCSYDRSSGTLFKETVLRMETPMADKAELMGWIKLA